MKNQILNSITKSNKNKFFFNRANKSFSELIKLKLNFPDTKSKTIQLHKTTTLKEFEVKLKELKSVEQVDFRSWDNAIVSRTNTLDTVLIQNKEPLFVKMDRMEWQELELSQESNETKPHSNLNEKDFITSTLKKINKNNNLSAKDFKEMEESIFQIKNYYNNQLSNKLIDTNKYRTLSNIMNDLYNYKREYQRLNNEYCKHQSKAEIKALIIILLGGLLFVIELILLYYGTFIEFSWDIVEPMTYLTTCLNVVLILLMKKKFKGLSAHDYFTKRFLTKRLNKFDLKRYNELRHMINDIEHKLV